MIPAADHPRPRLSPWWFSGAVSSVLLLGVAMRLVSPAVLLDIASLWPVGAGLLGLGWVARRIWTGGALADVPVFPLLVFSWLLVATSFHLAGLPGLPSSSADLRGPPADESRFDAFSVELRSGRLSVVDGTGPSAYRVDMMGGGGGAGAPVAVESGGPDGAEVSVVDVRQPFSPDIGVQVGDNPWLRFAGWEVSLHPGTVWNLTLTASDLVADLRGVPLVALEVNGRGTVRLGETDHPIPVSINGTVTVQVPPQTPVEVSGVAIVPEDWTVVEDRAWFGEPGTGWLIEVAETGSVQMVTVTD